jgi:RNA polymerase sigma factor (sigma-70 family)
MDQDKELARQLYEQYGFLVYRICLRILGSHDDARDALQTVFLKLLEHYATVTDKERIVPWIFTAAKNHCYNVLRFSKKFAGAVDADATPGSDRFDERLAAQELVRLAFINHNKGVRDAVYYTYAEELDQQEIGKLTGQSPATIRRNLKRFRESVPSIRARLEL